MKNKLYSSIHWGFQHSLHFLHNTMYTHTHTHTHLPIFTQKLTFVSEEKIKLFADFYTQHHTNSCSDILDANVLQK